MDDEERAETVGRSNTLNGNKASELMNAAINATNTTSENGSSKQSSQQRGWALLNMSEHEQLAESIPQSAKLGGSLSEDREEVSSEYN